MGKNKKCTKNLLAIINNDYLPQPIGEKVVSIETIAAMATKEPCERFIASSREMRIAGVISLKLIWSLEIAQISLFLVQ